MQVSSTRVRKPVTSLGMQATRTESGQCPPTIIDIRNLSGAGAPIRENRRSPRRRLRVRQCRTGAAENTLRPVQRILNLACRRETIAPFEGWGTIERKRRLEREAGRNVDVMWLLGRLAPDHKTIADFRSSDLLCLVSRFLSLLLEQLFLGSLQGNQLDR
jgi:hypothetical protein